MGDTSIIARRLRDGHVQYEFSGNGGYFKNVGFRLALWYQEPDDVEYLFGLGQTKLIGQRGSEKGGEECSLTHRLTYEPFWLEQSERNIFSKIMFIDYGYFYDLDNKWYYIIPGPFRIKMPCVLVETHLDDSDYEFDFRKQLIDDILRYIFTDYVEKDVEFQAFLAEKELTPEKIMDDIKEDNGLLSDIKFFDYHKSVFHYFDDWIVVETNEDEDEVTGFILKKKTEKHIETCEWGTMHLPVHMSRLTEFDEKAYVDNVRAEVMDELVSVVKRLRSGETAEQLMADGVEEALLTRALKIV